jgi:glycerol-3-phosphate dehydrogenase
MKRFIEEPARETFDVVIAGGGITGAAVAYEAASRGLKTALVEKKDFSWATSSATSKLIHGGLRYLANAEFTLVRESLKERRVLQNIAPNLVHPIPMMMVHDSVCPKNKPFEIAIGLWIYDLLAFDRNRTWDPTKKIPRHRRISREEAMILEPGIFARGMKGASIFYDCLNAFPERLTLAFVKSACVHGAMAANYARVDEFMMEGQRVRGVVVRDLLGGSVVELPARLVVNCTGPWADIVLGKAVKTRAAGSLTRSEGIHIVTRKRVNTHVVSYMTEAGRHFFMIPWRNHTLIGTTDQPYTGSPDDYRVTPESIRGLIDEVNGTLGADVVNFDDVLYSYGGLRPLVEDVSADTYGASRRYEIQDNAEDGIEGLVTVEGGKFTTSRMLAEKTVDIAERKLARRRIDSPTASRYLWGCQIPDMRDFTLRLFRDNRDFDWDTLEYLGRNYGTETDEVLALARTDRRLRERLDRDGEIAAQVVHAVRNEMARTLEDIVLRRTGIGSLGEAGGDTLEETAQAAASELGWDRERICAEVEGVRRVLAVPGK